jgi:hypothetical protein
MLTAAHIHFNHFINAQEQVIAHQNLLKFIARGAAIHVRCKLGHSYLMQQHPLL